MTAATACLPVDVLATHSSRERRFHVVEREFLERVAHAASLSDVTAAADQALQYLGVSRAA